MERRAVWYAASVAEPESVSTPVAEFHEPVMPAWLVKASTSWPEAKFALMLMVAPESEGLSVSESTTPESTTVAVDTAAAVRARQDSIDAAANAAAEAAAAAQSKRALERERAQTEAEHRPTQTKIDSANAAAAARERVAAVNSDALVAQMEPMQAIVERTLRSPRFNLLLIGCFAGLALLLAAWLLAIALPLLLGQLLQLCS